MRWHKSKVDSQWEGRDENGFIFALIEKISCGGQSYIYSVYLEKEGKRFGPFRRLDRAKYFVEHGKDNPVLLHLLGV
jgi:hypothetical protein